MVNKGSDSKVTLWLLNSKSVFPLVWLGQLLIWLAVRNGDLGNVIDEGVVIFYMVIPLGFIIYGEITIKDMEVLIPKFRGDVGYFEKLLGTKRNGKLVPMHQSSFLVQWLYFLLFFGITVVAVFLLEVFTPIESDTVIVPFVPGIILFHLLLVIPSETIVFSTIIPLKLRLFFNGRVSNSVNFILRIIISQSIFSITHIFVFGPSLVPLIWAFAWGSIFVILIENWGISSGAGAHFGVNMVMSGVFAYQGWVGGTMNLMVASDKLIIIMSVLLIIAFMYSFCKKIIRRCKIWLSVQRLEKQIC